ncbi:VanZ family protein [Clostridium sp. 1001275B_160808_H3]|uniref:VanZ family protein n=1 Tax=Clostridium sp. 1001275B_160808_H3 TaxID=2787110 RepID=UPI001898CE3D|nr:VanZ family protein [Clostridium sp. 1001275B_160808_H3]
MNKICKYAKKSVRKLDMTLKERRELELEFIDHMTEIYNNYKDEGYSEEDATIKSINTFKKDNFKVIDNSKKINKLLYFIFGLYCVGFALIYFYASFRFDFFHTRININWLIPFKRTLFHLTESFQNNNMSIEFLKAQLLFFIAFIPLGTFIPIIISKYNSFADNFKIYLFISITLQLIKIPLGHGIVCIDYIIIGIVGCLIGYGLLKMIHKTILNVNTAKLI